MIAPIESISKITRRRNTDVENVASVEADFNEPNARDKALQVTKQWIAQHTTTAVVTSIVLGLLVGYVVKRQRR